MLATLMTLALMAQVTVGDTGPTIPILGRVVDAESGQGLAGIPVEIQASDDPLIWSSTAGQTDAEGRYRVPVPAARRFVLVAAKPSRASKYLAATSPVRRLEAGATQCEVNLSLRLGVVLQGRVTDRASGRPLAGVAVRCTALPPEAEPSITDAEGRYALLVSPGRGWVTAEADSNDYVLMRQAVADEPPSDPSRSWTSQAHAFARYETSTPTEVDLTLLRGATIQLRVVGPDGAQVSAQVALETDLRSSELATRQGVFTLYGVPSDRTVRCDLIDYEHHWVRTLDVGDPGVDADGVIEARLEPSGSLTMRVVDEAKRPIAGTCPPYWLASGPEDRASSRSASPPAERMTRLDYVAPPTDVDGRTTITDLLPGERYRVRLTAYRDQEGRFLWASFVAQPGLTADLGDVRIEPQPEVDARARAPLPPEPAPPTRPVAPAGE
jgi:hypothetical protein